MFLLFKNKDDAIKAEKKICENMGLPNYTEDGKQPTENWDEPVDTLDGWAIVKPDENFMGDVEFFEEVKSLRREEG